MAKNDIQDSQIEYLKVLEKISNSPALNGGFDRLSENIDDIKTTQMSMKNDISKVSTEVENVKNNFGRMEEKIDRIYDPERGLFSRVADNEFSIEKNETSLENMSLKLDSFNIVFGKISEIEKETREITQRIKTLRNITGENYEELSSAIKVKNNMSKIVWLFAAGLASTLAKIIWDILSN